MSDLPRLLDDPQLDPVARAVLRSAETDAPSNDRRAAVAAGLGLGALVSGGATTASASAAAWWLVPLIVVGVATSGAIGYVALRGEPAPQVMQVEVASGPRTSGLGPRPDPTPRTVEPAAPQVDPVAIAPPVEDPAPPRHRAPKPEARGPRPEAAVVPAPPAPPPIDARRLKEETDLLSLANAALRAGDPAKALAALDRHAAEFPDGVLREQAQVIRIGAVLRTDHDAGIALGEQFLAEFPKSPHARRVRSLLGRKSP